MLNVKKEFTYPRNLIVAIFKDEEHPAIYFSDLELRVSLALRLLTDLERSIISLKYEKGLTLKQIGSVLNFSRSYIAQVKDRSIRKLRSSHASLYIKFSLEEIADMALKERELLEIENIPTLLKVECLKDLEQIQLRDLDLRARTFGCIDRWGYKTMGDVYRELKEDPYILNRVKNLGKRGWDEILGRLASYVELPTGVFYDANSEL